MKELILDLIIVSDSQNILQDDETKDEYEQTKQESYKRLIKHLERQVSNDKSKV